MPHMGFPPESGSQVATLTGPPSLPPSSGGLGSAAKSRAELFASVPTEVGEGDEARSRLTTHVLDRLGISLSVICAAHCVLTPILVAAAPLLFTTEFEHRTKAILVLIAVVALGAGYLNHRSWRPFPWLALAVGVFAVEHAHPSLWWEVSAAVVASGALILAHLSNSRACRAAASHGH